MSITDMMRMSYTKGEVEQKEVERAFGTYLNQTGPGQYEARSMVGSRQVEAQRRNSPYFSFKDRTRLPYFPTL